MSASPGPTRSGECNGAQPLERCPDRVHHQPQTSTAIQRRTIMKPLSDQLEDLSKRAKKAEEDSAAAQTEARTEVQTRIDQLKADAATRTAEIKAATASTKAT